MKGGSLIKNMDRGKMSEAIHMDRGKISEAIHSQGKTQQVQLRLPFAVAKLPQQMIRDYFGVTNVARHR